MPPLESALQADSGGCWPLAGHTGRCPGRALHARGADGNEPGQPALYLSDSHATAIAEYQQDLPRPGTLTAFDVGAFGMIDLGDPVVQQALGIEGAFLRQPWKQMRDIERARPPSWDFARAAHAAGWVGLISQMLGRVKRFRKAVVGETDIDAQRARHLGAEHLELERVQVREIKDLAADA